MSKQKTTTRRRSTKKPATLTKAPAGLHLLLSMFDDYPDSPMVHARARQILADRDKFRVGHLDAIQVRESIKTAFPDGDVTASEPCLASILKAGVLLGLATGWLLATDLAGGTR